MAKKNNNMMIWIVAIGFLLLVSLGNGDKKTGFGCTGFISETQTIQQFESNCEDSGGTIIHEEQPGGLYCNCGNLDTNAIFNPNKPWGGCGFRGD